MTDSKSTETDEKQLVLASSQGPSAGLSGGRESGPSGPELPPSLTRPIGFLLLAMLPLAVGQVAAGLVVLLLGGGWLGASLMRRRAWEARRNERPAASVGSSAVARASAPASDPDKAAREQAPATPEAPEASDAEDAASATTAQRLTDLLTQLKAWDREARAAEDDGWPVDGTIAERLSDAAELLERALGDTSLVPQASEVFSWLDGLYEPVAQRWYEDHQGPDGEEPPFVSARNALLPLLREASPGFEVERWIPADDLELPVATMAPQAAAEASGDGVETAESSDDGPSADGSDEDAVEPADAAPQEPVESAGGMPDDPGTPAATEEDAPVPEEQGVEAASSVAAAPAEATEGPSPEPVDDAAAPVDGQGEAPDGLPASGEAMPSEAELPARADATSDGPAGPATGAEAAPEVEGPPGDSLPVVNAVEDDGAEPDDFETLFGGGAPAVPEPAAPAAASAPDDAVGPPEPDPEAEGRAEPPQESEVPGAAVAESGPEGEPAVEQDVPAAAEQSAEPAPPSEDSAPSDEEEGPPPALSAEELAGVDSRLHPIISAVQDAYRNRLDWDYYSFIGVSQEVTAEEAKRAINALARGYRAVYDVSSVPESVRSEARSLLVRLKKIRSTLADPEARLAYDEGLSGALDRVASSMTMERIMALSSDRLETVDALDPEAGFEKAQALIADERWTMAYTLLLRLRERAPSDARILALLGWAASHMDEVPAEATEQVAASPLDRAHEWLTLALTFDKRQPLALRYLCMLRIEAGDWEPAQRALRAYAATRHDLAWASEQAKLVQEKLSEADDDADSRRGAWKLWKKN